MPENERDILKRIIANSIATREAAQNVSKAKAEADEEAEKKATQNNPVPIPLNFSKPTSSG